MTALGATTDPIALIPGDVGGLFETVEAWRSRATTAASVAQEVAALATPAGWEGEAASGFADRRQRVSAAWEALEKMLTTAVDALDSYGTTLGWAQQKAADAISMWATAQTLTASSVAAQREAERAAHLAGARGVIPPFVDGGAQARKDAQDLLDYARAEVTAAGDAATDALQALTPPEVTPWDMARATATVMLVMQGHIAWNGLVDTVNGVASVGNAMLRHPEALLALLGGAGMMVGGAGLFGGGGAVSLTGVGATVGVPAAAGGIGLMGAGAAAAGAGVAVVAVDAMGPGRVEPLQRSDPNRDERGRFAKENQSPGKDKEAQGLDEFEETTGQELVRKQTKAMVEGGNPNGRYFDGLYRNPDGTWTAVEVKSATASKDANQRVFDDIVNNGTPATATVNGERIRIVRVVLKEVP